MTGTHEVKFFIESDDTLVCKGVWVETYLQPMGGGYFRWAQREHAEEFGAEGSGVLALEQWAKKYCDIKGPGSGRGSIYFWTSYLPTFGGFRIFFQEGEIVGVPCPR